MSVFTNLKPIYARISIFARTRSVFHSVLLFFAGLIIFTQLSVFTQPASAISFTTNSVRPADVLDYEALGYTYDTVSIRGSNTNLKVRKNAATLTPDEISRFVNAVINLKKTMTSGTDGTSISIFDQFVATHLGTSDVAGRIDPTGRRFSNPAHGNAAFLPWHREFLYEFEYLLQVVDPSVTIPYWDFTDRDSAKNIIFQNNFMGPNGGSSGVGGGAVQSGFFSAANKWLQRKDLSGNTWTGKSRDTQPLTRYMRAFDRLPTQAQVDQTLAQTTYDKFRSSLENTAHATAHLWMGGSTANVATSPNDPMFWLLHANVDRIWAEWQLNGHWGSNWYTGNGKPLGHNLNDLMWPWDQGYIKAAADLQALIPSQTTSQARNRASMPSVEFRVASSPEELMSDRTGQLYNPFGSSGEHEMHNHMLCEVNSSSDMQCDNNADNIAVASSVFSPA